MLLRRRVLEHLRVHCRAHDERRARGERSQAHHLLSEAERQPRDNRGGGRRDNEHLGLSGQRDVRFREIAVCVPHVPIGAPTADALKRDRCDKFSSFRRHDHVENGSRLGELTGQIDGLVDGDTAGHAEHDVAVRQVVHGSATVHVEDEAEAS